MWVANEGGHTVTELRASDGTVLGTFPGPNSPYGVAFDGTYIWVSGDIAMMVLRASDGAQVLYRNVQSEGVAFDGAHIWTAIQGFNILQKF
jgi:DNA-binding beta-propeller fold protein YncE